MKLLTPKKEEFSESQKDILLVEVVRKLTIRMLLIFMLLSNVFLFLRFFLRLFGADPANGFASFVFFISSIFMFPFFGIFPQFRDDIISGQMTFDFSAITAGFCYNILIIMTMILMQVITSILRARRQARESLQKSRPINTQSVDKLFSHNQP